MIIDCHYHFDQRLLAEDKLLKKMDDVELVALCDLDGAKVSFIAEKNNIPIVMNKCMKVEYAELKAKMKN